MYVTCMLFSFDLLILVFISEWLRALILGTTSNYTLQSEGFFFFVVLVAVPIFLFGMWLLVPDAVNKLFTTFRLSEEEMLIEEKNKLKTNPKPNGGDSMEESEDLEKFVASTINSIKKGIPEDYRLEGQVDFELAVVKVKEAKGGFKLFVADASGSYGKEAISRIKFSVGKERQKQVVIGRVQT